MTQCLINQAIQEAVNKGENLNYVQQVLKEKNISIDIETLKQRSKNIKR